MSSFPSTLYCRDYPFPIVCSWCPCRRPADRILISLLLGSLLCSTDLCVCLLLCQYHAAILISRHCTEYLYETKTPLHNKGNHQQNYFGFYTQSNVGNERQGATRNPQANLWHQLVSENSTHLTLSTPDAVSDSRVKLSVPIRLPLPLHPWIQVASPGCYQCFMTPSLGLTNFWLVIHII